MSALIIAIDRPAYGGLSIGRHEGKIVMVRGAVLPGETAEIVVEKEKKDYLTATVKKIIEPSPHRVEPPCKYFGICGGCQLQHISYKRQITLKEEILGDCLRRLAKKDIQLSGPLTDSNPWHYRLRGQFKASHRGIGFYRENSREVVAVDSCPLMTEEINALLRKIKPATEDLDMKEIHITAGDCSTALIKLSSRMRSVPAMQKVSSMLLDLGISGLCIETPDKKITRYGRTHTTLALLDLKYGVSPMTFFQSHWRLNQQVVGFIKNEIRSLKGKRVLDMYAGAGNFSMPLALDNEVTAIEENPFAVEDGRRNLETNKIKNCRFIRSSAEDLHAEGAFDVVILDPPRGGLTNRVMAKMLSMTPEKIIYISCNPSTFARDLKKLLAKYDIESVRMIDFFPQTFHIESLAFLRLR
jgi:23S rRNA (uracil1939-C5)-methyltransferase